MSHKTPFSQAAYTEKRRKGAGGGNLGPPLTRCIFVALGKTTEEADWFLFVFLFFSHLIKWVVEVLLLSARETEGGGGSVNTHPSTPPTISSHPPHHGHPTYSLPLFPPPPPQSSLCVRPKGMQPNLISQSKQGGKGGGGGGKGRGGADKRRWRLYFNLLFCRSLIYVPQGAFFPFFLFFSFCRRCGCSLTRSRWGCGNWKEKKKKKRGVTEEAGS